MFRATLLSIGLSTALLLAIGAGSARASCTPTGFYADGMNLTAAMVIPAGAPVNVTGSVNGTGCNVGVFFGPGTSGTVDSTDVYGANYYGIVVAGDTSLSSGVTSVDVTNNTVHDIGESPLNGTQHGNAIYYRACTSSSSATGSISGNTIANYQKGGIVVSCAGVGVTISDNIVTGQGPVDYIAQNGIQVGYGATAQVMRNKVTGNSYTGGNFASSAGILVIGGACFAAGQPFTVGTQLVKNVVGSSTAADGNDVGIWLANLDATCSLPTINTNIKAINNTLINGELTNATGGGLGTPYQAGIADIGSGDKLISNSISGIGYMGTGPNIWSIDTSATNKAKVHANSVP